MKTQSISALQTLRQLIVDLIKERPGVVPRYIYASPGFHNRLSQETHLVTHAICQSLLGCEYRITRKVPRGTVLVTALPI